MVLWVRMRVVLYRCCLECCFHLQAMQQRLRNSYMCCSISQKSKRTWEVCDSSQVTLTLLVFSFYNYLRKKMGNWNYSLRLPISPERDHRLGIWGNEGKRRQSSDGGIQGVALVTYTTPTDLQTGTPRLLDMNISSDFRRLLITHHLNVTLGKLLLSVSLLSVNKIKGLDLPESTES